MKTSRDNLKQAELVQEYTEGDGNCAFNAFILGLCRQEVLDGIERELAKKNIKADDELKEFIQRAAIQLEVEANWQAVKAKLIAMRQSDKVALQNKLAQIMRDIAIQQARNSNFHYHQTVEPLTSAFVDMGRQALGLNPRGVAEDIYRKHDFILKKFQGYIDQFGPWFLENGYDDGFDVVQYQALQAKYQVLKAKDEKLDADEKLAFENLGIQLDLLFGHFTRQLQYWWEVGDMEENIDIDELHSGYGQFLDAMQLDGKWAGDLELAEVANYFHVNLDVVRPDDQMPHHIHIDHGALPIQSNEDGYALSQVDIGELVVRGIVDRPVEGATQLNLLPLTHEQVDAKLSAVPDVDAVIELMAEHAHDGKKLRKLQLPPDWPAECKNALVARDAVTRKDKINFRFMDASLEDAETRVKEMASKSLLLAAWDKYHEEAPTITLTNPRAVHWSNMLPSDAPELVASSSPAVVAPTPKVTSVASGVVATASTLSDIASTLALIQSGEIQPSEEKWEAFIERKVAKDVAIPEAKKTIVYTISEPDKLETKVTIERQMKLDEELAKRWQQEEHDASLSKELQEKLDKELAEQLQREEEAKNRKTF